MDKYMIVLQMCAILFICFVGYFLIKFFVSLFKKNRLSYFSLDIGKEKYSEINSLYKIIYKFADMLKLLVIFNGISRTYDKYIDGDSKLRKGMDFIAVKILMGFLLSLLYLLVVGLSKDVVSPLLILITFILGFLLVDFYCVGVRRKKERIMNSSIINAVIVMNNSFKANRSIEQALGDVVLRTHGLVQLEFKKVLSDVRLGLSVADAMHRMYKRTDLDIILYLSNIFSLINKSNISLVDVFSSLEDKIHDEDKFNKEFKYINKVNNLARIIFLILPVLFIVTIIICNPDFLQLIISSNGYIVILVLVIIYILYLLLINKFVRSSRYGR